MPTVTINIHKFRACGKAAVTKYFNVLKGQVRLKTCPRDKWGSKPVQGTRGAQSLSKGQVGLKTRERDKWD